MHLFERPCPTGWIYPCSLQDIACRLARLPEEDIEGLWAVGLIPSTHKDNNANGRYFYSEQPVIHLYSYPEDLRYRLAPHTRQADIERYFSVELKYGMTTAREGSRFTCAWTHENLRTFIVQHVLLHEIGHHVYHWRRKQEGRLYRRNKTESEQFAEAYALRCQKQPFHAPYDAGEEARLMKERGAPTPPEAIEKRFFGHLRPGCQYGAVVGYKERR